MVKKRITPIQLIYLLFSIGTGTMLLSLILSNGAFLERMVYDFSHFVDFYDHVRRFYLELNMVYDEGMHASFPPLAYLLYALTARVLYQDNAADPDGLSQSGSGMLVFCMLLVLFTAGFVCVFQSLFHMKEGGRKNWLAVMILISYPFWLAVERGNMSLLVLLILLLAVAWKDSEQRWKREAALLLFAAAAGLKLYPAIFGILYLAEKRYQEAGRLILYGLFFFFAPFAFFHGIDGFRAFYRNISAVGSGATGVTIVGLAGRIGEKLGIGLAQGHAIGKGLSYMYFVIALLLSFFTGKMWKRVLLLTSLMIIFVPASGTYCLIYATIPLVCFLNDLVDGGNGGLMDTLYAVLFSLVFVAYPVKAAGSSGMLYIALYALLAAVILEEGAELIRKWSAGKRGDRK